MERRLANVAHQRQQPAQDPDIERRMRVTLHIDQHALEDVLKIQRVEWFDLCMLGASEVIDVVALDRLI